MYYLNKLIVFMLWTVPRIINVFGTINLSSKEILIYYLL